jgi:hypothetical protein
MIDQANAASVPHFGFADRLIQGLELQADFTHDRFRRSASRPHGVGRISSWWKVSEFSHQQGFQTLPDGGRTGQRFSCLQTTSESPPRIPVGEIEVFEDFRRAPLAFRMPHPSFRCHIAGGRKKGFV